MGGEVKSSKKYSQNLKISRFFHIHKLNPHIWKKLWASATHKSNYFPILIAYLQSLSLLNIFGLWWLNEFLYFTILTHGEHSRNSSHFLFSFVFCNSHENSSHFYFAFVFIIFSLLDMHILGCKDAQR